MKRTILVAITFIFHYCSQAQCSDPLFSSRYSSSQSLLFFGGDYSIGSNVITTNFSNTFYKGGFINESMKDKVAKKLLNENRLGASLNVGIECLFLPDTLFSKTHLGIFAALKDREHFDVGFSPDLFKLGFYGNKSYEGKTAHLGDFNLNLLRYQQLQLGFLWAGLDTAKAKLGVGISILKGEQLLFLNAKKADLFTSSDGLYIDLSTSANMLQSDTSQRGITAFNGTGASIDLSLEAPYRLKKRKGVIRIRITDMGTIFWNNQSLSYRTDSTYHYTGYQVNNIFNLQDSTFKSSATQDIVNDNLQVQHKSFSTTIPATISLTTTTTYGKLNITKGFRYLFNANYKGLFFLQGNYFIRPSFMLGASAAYGGYGNFSYGIEVATDLGKGIIVHAGSNNIEGFIAPKNTTGQGAYLSIKKHF